MVVEVEDVHRESEFAVAVVVVVVDAVEAVVVVVK